MVTNVSKITFSFGKNWQDFLSTVDDSIIEKAGQDIDDWLENDWLKNKRVIDIGSGSGLSSINLYRRGVSELVSFDYDPASVQATQVMHERQNSPENWRISEGSILDSQFISSLGKFDLVYSWGVLHHTGNLYQALENAFSICDDNGYVLISLYQAGDLYQEHLTLKERYNIADEQGKNSIIYEQVKMWHPNLEPDLALQEMRQKVDARGMNEYNDLLDWLGGLPYEVAYPSEVIIFAAKYGLKCLRVLERGQGGCSVYLFHKISEPILAYTSSFIWKFVENNQTEERTLLSQIRSDLAILEKRISQKKIASSLSSSINKPLKEIIKDRIKIKLKAFVSKISSK